MLLSVDDELRLSFLNFFIDRHQSSGVRNTATQEKSQCEQHGGQGMLRLNEAMGENSGIYWLHRYRGGRFGDESVR